MKKAAKPKRDPDMLAECDFSQGVQGKLRQAMSDGTNTVLLLPTLLSSS